MRFDRGAFAGLPMRQLDDAHFAVGSASDNGLAIAYDALSGTPGSDLAAPPPAV